LAKVALITGATSGIGRAFALRLSLDGYGLILTGRREKELAALANKIRGEGKADVRLSIGDLADAAYLEELARLASAEPELEMLVNNAGFGIDASFIDDSLESELSMLDVHVRAPLALTKACIPGMVKRGKGSIVNVASMAAFLILPGNGLYGETKAFLHHFSQTMAIELHGKGVRVLSLCPGFTHTDFHGRLGIEGKMPENFFLRWMKPDEVVARALKDLRRGRTVSIPGAMNRLLVSFARAVPQALYVRIAKALLKPAKSI
jgi:short-subunit dehydrogenase